MSEIHFCPILPFIQTIQIHREIPQQAPLTRIHESNKHDDEATNLPPYPATNEPHPSQSTSPSHKSDHITDMPHMPHRRWHCTHRNHKTLPDSMPRIQAATTPNNPPTRAGRIRSTIPNLRQKGVTASPQIRSQH